ncbi:MAG TPA: hypothetical protein VLI55_22000 [Bryobacteraceae bacterium]|nr:hypothetical protein [Bryobacteraceae bacterium]
MVIKAYCDGGNLCDSRVHETATIACIIGRPTVFRTFERHWKVNLRKHKVAYLHTTDAVSFKGIYAKWWDEDDVKGSKARRDAFLRDCGNIIAGCALQCDEPKEKLPSTLVPMSVTLNLSDFKRAQLQPSGPQDATEILATQALSHVVDCASIFKSHFIELFFDRNEPYRGHVDDRVRNGKFLAEMKARGMDLQRYMLLHPPLDMRDVPELQAADLFAWAVENTKPIRFDWQHVLLRIPSTLAERIDYDLLQKADPLVEALAKHCNFPKRRATP